MEMILCAALIFVLANLALGVTLWLRVRKLYSYPGLLGSPVIGNLYYFYRTLFLFSLDSSEEYFSRIVEKHGKDGLCFTLGFGYRTLLIVSNPHIVKEIRHHPNLSDKPTVYSGLIPYIGGIITRYRADEIWKEQRKIYNTALKKSHVDTAFLNTFNKCADKLIDRMLASGSVEDPIYEVRATTHYASIETLFGVENSLVCEPEIIKLMKWVVDIASYAAANPIISRIGLNIFRLFDEIVFKKGGELRKLISGDYHKILTSEHYPVPGKEPPLAMQIVSRHMKSNGSRKKWVNMNLETELQELFVASSQTLAITLSNSLIFLAVLSDIQERAWKEQFEIFGDDKRDPSIVDLKDMHFLDRVIKEALRFGAITIISKVATDDTIINGIKIPRGTNVLYFLRNMGMDPKYWKDPEVFDPDRFLQESDALKYSYAPFGIGIRSCPGMYFATTQIKITLSKILRRLKLSPVQKDFHFKDIKFKSGILTEVMNPPELQVEERT